jgi:hypothetical protein
MEEKAHVRTSLFECPITQVMMVEPVQSSVDGFTYERTAIEEWISVHHNSPITREPMEVSDLKLNRAIFDAITEIIKTGEGDEDFEHIEDDDSIPKDTTELIRMEDLQHCAVKVRCSGKKDGTGSTNVEIIPPNLEKRLSSDIVCVIDISGSMQIQATMQDEAGESKEDGFSILDIVKHAVKSVIHMMQPVDRMSLVVFSTNVKVIFPFTFMTNSAKIRAVAMVDNLRTESATNLWGGLCKGLDVLKERTDTKRNSSLMLFTDGVSNIRPSRSEDVMLEMLKKKDNIHTPIHTFGFGYNLKSELLYDLSVIGNGMYNYIPDVSFIGTIFVNALSNIMSTMFTNVRVHFYSPIEHDGIYPKQAHEGETIVDIGSINFGQTRNIPVKPYGITHLTLEYCIMDKHISETHTITEISCENTIYVEQFIRAKFISDIKKAMTEIKYSHHEKAIDIIDKLLENVLSFSSQSERIQGILVDLVDQVKVAFSKLEYYNKWGPHYLFSLLRSHQLEICNNFKDKSVQFYGGELFKTIRETADTIYNKLPPPTPSCVPVIFDGFGHSIIPKSTVDMSTYNNASNGCFGPDSLVRMEDGTKKIIQTLKKGDVVATPYGVASIICVIKTKCKNGVADLVKFKSGFTITPWHPILSHRNSDGNVWKFPADIKKSSIVECPAVYNLVLDKFHVVLINNIPCVTLGHNIDEEVVRHPYFGTDAIVTDLKKMPGWSDGLIVFEEPLVERDSESNLITRLVYIK